MKRAQQLGRYHLLDRIAFGGMAEIYRARTFDKHGQAHMVAVKRVLAHLAEDDEFIQMLVDEAKIASVLRHPNIARVYEFAKSSSEYFMSMEHVDGKDMRSTLERCRNKKVNMPPEHAVYICAEIAAGLHAAHAAVDAKDRPLRIIHRDVSPSNILVSYTGEVKICDFGIAKATLSRVQTRPGVIKGKVKYMSPEQALGKKLDHRSDVFSLGASLYEMLTRVTPFAAANDMDVLIKVRDARYRPIIELEPTIDPALIRIVDRCLFRSRAARYQTAADLEADLRAYLAVAAPHYTRSHLGHYVRKLFAAEIDKELRMLEEYVLDDAHVSDDLGENLISGDKDLGTREVDFMPRPATSTAARIKRADDFAGDSNVTTAPQGEAHPAPGVDIHVEQTQILSGRRPRPGGLVTTSPQAQTLIREALILDDYGNPVDPNAPMPSSATTETREPTVHDLNTDIINLGRRR